MTEAKKSVGNPNFKNKWEHGETTNIRVPKVLKDKVLYLARLLDQGKVTIDQVEALIDDSDLFNFDFADRPVVFINGSAKNYQFSKTINGDRQIELLKDYPLYLDQWEEKDFKRLIRQLNLIETKPLKLIFDEISDYSGLNLIEIQVWEGSDE